MKKSVRKKRIKYTAGEIGRVRVVKDFLPSPGKSKSDWKAAAKKPVPDGSDPDDAMEEVEETTTEMPKPPGR